MFDSGISVVNSKLALHPHTNELVCFSSNVLSAVLIVDARIKAAMHRRTHTFDLQPNSGCLRRVPLCHVSTSLDANSPHVQLLAHIHAYTLVDTSSGQYETFDVGGKQCSSALLDTAITSISHGTSISPAIVLCSQGLVALQSTLPAKPVSAMLDNNANDDVDCDRLLKIANSFQTVIFKLFLILQFLLNLIFFLKRTLKVANEQRNSSIFVKSVANIVGDVVATTHRRRSSQQTSLVAWSRCSIIIQHSCCTTINFNFGESF